ncbi:5465_t:CDS:2 [Funneliformis caledonium]|uniref:5465_t:CDS:1 n=1 Tax=Funneliformis caledonium TaxID=1117310 RepID=A0A9N9DSF8_9GLOM|nr:5465_t:CDS:2 [Funneliformis caledonium]
MDNKLKYKTSEKGIKYVPKYDLHGCTKKKACKEVKNVILRCSELEISSINFITGRGNHKNLNGDRAVLFKNFPVWLNDPKVSSLIKDSVPGDGSYKVYLNIEENKTIKNVVKNNAKENKKKVIENKERKNAKNINNAMKRKTMRYSEKIDVKSEQKKKTFTNYSSKISNMDPKTGLPRSRRSTASGDDAPREGLTTETHDWTLIKAIELVANQKVIIIDGETAIEEACDILIKNNISSAPVYDNKTKTYVGMFDWADVMTYLLIVLKKKDILEQQQKSDEELTSEFNDLLKLAIQCQPVPVKLASDLSNKNPFYSVYPETSLLQVVELFGSGTHRVVVVDADGNMKGILSQSRIEDLDIGRSTVISAQADSFVLEALTMMNKNSLSSIAIVNDDGVLLGNISMTDVKYILRSYSHSLMWRTCKQFVNNVRIRQGLEDGKDRFPVFDVRLTSTLGYTIAKLVATKAHRVWVVDDRMQAIGLVSLTDVLGIIARSAGANPRPKRPGSISSSSTLSNS